MKSTSRWALIVAILGGVALLLYAADVFNIGPADDGPGGDEIAHDGESMSAEGADDGATLRGTQDGEPVAPPLVAIAGPKLTGRVIDEAGSGVPNALVISFADDLDGTINEKRLAEEDFRGGSARTDKDGYFEVPVTDDAPFHYLLATAKGYTPTIETALQEGAKVELTLAPSIAVVGTVRNKEKEPLAGARVTAWFLVDAFEIKREAVSDAQGRYRLDDVPAEVSTMPGRWTGYFRVNWLEARAKGYAPVLIASMAPSGEGAEKTFDITLVKGGSLTGTVTDGEAGTPIAGARVVLYSLEGMHGYGRMNGGSYSNPFSPRIVFETTTDEHGAYAFANVPSQGPHGVASNNMGNDGRMALGGVIAIKDGYSSMGARLPIPNQGEELERDMKMWPAAHVKGRVLNGDGTPRKNAYVSILVDGRRFNASTPKGLEDIPMSWARSGEDGTFLITGAPASREMETDAQLSIWPGYDNDRTKPRLKQLTKPVTFKYGEVTDLGDISLETPEPVFSTWIVVLKPDGTPCYGAQVNRGHRSNMPRTDRDGRVPWAWGARNEKYPWKPQTVVAKAQGFAPTPVTLQPPGEGQDEVTVTLDVAHFVAGRVVRADGSPAANATVNVGDGNLPPEKVFPARQGFVVPGRQTSERGLPMVYASVQTDEDGRFEVKDLPDGPYHLRATVGRRVPVPGKPDGMILAGLLPSVSADIDTAEIRLPVDDSPEVGAVKGQVVDAESGEGIQGLQLSLMKDGKSVGHAFNNPRMYMAGSRGSLKADGTFEMKNVPVGTCKLVATAPGFARTEIDGIVVRTGGATDVPLVRMGRGTVVTGRVSSSEPLKGRKITFYNKSNYAMVQADIGKDGTYRAGGFAPGTYDIRVYAQRFQREGPPPLLPEGVRTLTIKAETTGEVRRDIRLVPAGTIAMQPMDKRLPPMPWSSESSTKEQSKFGEAASVRITASDGTLLFEHKGLTRGGGIWSHQLVLPGTYTVRLELPGEDPKEERVDVEPGATKTISWK